MTDQHNTDYPSQPTPAWSGYEERHHGNPWMRRLVYLIGGFNAGFLGLMVVILLVLPNMLADFNPRRARGESAELPATELTQPAQEIAFVVVTAQPTETPLPSPTVSEPTAEPVITEEVAQVAPTDAPTLAPTATLFPSATPVPATPTPQPAPDQYFLEGHKFVLQTWNNCGPANVSMALSYLGWEVDQRDAASFLKPDREDKNVSPDQMVAFVTQNTNFQAIYRVNGTLDMLRWLIANRFSVIVEAGYEPPGEDWYGHYLTAVGYTANPAEFTFYDSNLGRASSPSVSIQANDFDSQWQAFNRTFIVIFPPARQSELQTFLGRDWNEVANWRGAVERAREEAANQPDNAFAWFNLGTALTMTGDYVTGARAFDQARNIGLPWRMLWYQFAPYEAYFQSSRLDDVVALAEATLRTTTYVEETYYYLGRVYEIRGDITTAIEQYEAALDVNKNYNAASLALARLQSS